MALFRPAQPGLSGAHASSVNPCGEVIFLFCVLLVFSRTPQKDYACSLRLRQVCTAAVRSEVHMC